MGRQNGTPEVADKLRKKAEEQLKMRKSETTKAVSGADMQRLVHELQVHQLELEMQNEELFTAKEQIEKLAKEQYKELYDFAPYGYLSISKEGTIAELNFAAARMLGRERDELKNTRFARSVSEETRPVFDLYFQQVFAGQAEPACEAILAAEGHWPIHVSIDSVVSRNDECCHLTVVDITGRKQAEEALQTEKANLDAIFKSSPDAMFILDETTTIVKLNTAAMLMANSSESDALQHRPGNVLRCIHSLTDPRGCGYSPNCKVCKVRIGIETLIAKGDAIHGAELELELIRNGMPQKVWINIGAEPIRLNGKRHVCVVLNDITGRKQTERLLQEKSEKITEQNEELNQTNQKLSTAKETAEANHAKVTAIIEGTQDSIWAFNRNYEILYLNKAFQAEFHQVFGIWLEPGVSLIKSHPRSIRPLWKSRYDRVLANEQFSVEDAILTRNGLIYIHVSFNPIVTKGKVVGGSCIGGNITERKQAELHGKLQNEELKKLNATKDKFFSIIAHDLKSPFNSIMGFSELLVGQIRQKDYKGIERYSGIIHQSSLHAMDLLMNLMEWSRAQTGRMEFNPGDFEAAALMDEVILLLSTAARQKSIVIRKAFIPFSLVYADRNMISTVLRNLISNAIKFTPPHGEIRLSCVKKERELIVSVADNGVGMTEDKMNRIFRIDENHSTLGTQNEQGTGLGLILCKEFVEKHGGKIRIESKVGIGSTFYFSLPIPFEPAEN